MPFSDISARLVGNSTGAAIQWSRRPRGCDNPAATEGISRVQASEQAQPKPDHEGGGGAMPWTYPCSIPQEGQGGVDGDSETVGLEGTVGDGRRRYPSGAVRSHLPERYDLVPTIGLQRVAMTMAEGAAKYGEYNWQKGFPVNDILNHALAHVFKYLSGDRAEDHLGHAAANLLMAIHTEESDGQDRR